MLQMRWRWHCHCQKNSLYPHFWNCFRIQKAWMLQGLLIVKLLMFFFHLFSSFRKVRFCYNLFLYFFYLSQDASYLIYTVFFTFISLFYRLFFNEFSINMLLCNLLWYVIIFPFLLWLIYNSKEGKAYGNYRI